MAELAGNLLVGQSGGPTAVINASVAGVLQEAGRHECIEEIYGGLNGIHGILNEELIDINEEKSRTIESLKHTPAAALGTCRYKIDFKKKPEKAAKDMDRLFEVFQAHNIRYFFYAGGNDSQDTAHKMHEEALRRGYEMRNLRSRYLHHLRLRRLDLRFGDFDLRFLLDLWWRRNNFDLRHRRDVGFGLFYRED